MSVLSIGRWNYLVQVESKDGEDDGGDCHHVQSNVERVVVEHYTCSGGVESDSGTLVVSIHDGALLDGGLWDQRGDHLHCLR